MAKKNITVNFFGIHVEGMTRAESRAYAKSLFKYINGLGNAQKWIKSYDDKIGIIRKEIYSDARLYVMLRRRIVDFTSQCDENFNLDEIHLNQNHSLTESGAFAYLWDLGMIAYAGSPLEIGWTQLSYYLRVMESVRNSENERIIQMLPLIDSRTNQKLQRMNYPKKFMLKVYRPYDWIDSMGDDTKAILQSGGSEGVDYLTVELTASRRRDGLIEKARDYVRDFLGRLNSKSADENGKMHRDIQELKLVGYNSAADGREKISIDFVQDRIFYKTSILYDDEDTVESYGEKCQGVLRNAIDSRRAIFESALQDNGD